MQNKVSTFRTKFLFLSIQSQMGANIRIKAEFASSLNNRVKKKAKKVEYQRFKLTDN